MIELLPAEKEALLLSLKVAATATVVSLPAGFLVAAAMTYVRFRGKVIAETILNLPLTLPPVVIGYFLLLLLGNNGIFGRLLASLGIRIVFTWAAAAIASAVVGFPLLVKSVRVSMEAIDPRLIEASRTLGATWYDTLLTVIFPLSRRGIVAGSSLMFARSMGEFGATIVVAGNIPGVTQTIPLAIFDSASSPGGEGSALLLCGLAVAVSVAVLVVHEAVGGRPGRGA